MNNILSSIIYIFVTGVGRVPKIIFPRSEENLAKYAISVFRIITNVDKGKLHLLKV